MKDYYNETVEEVIKKLKTSLSGLNEKEVEHRLEKYGYNELPKKETNFCV